MDSECAGQRCIDGMCAADERTAPSPLGVRRAPSVELGLAPTFEVDLGERVVGAPCLSPDGSAVLVTLGGRVVRLSASGELLAERELGATHRVGPASDVLGRIALLDTTGFLRVLDASLAELARVPLEDARDAGGRIVSLPVGVFAVPTLGVAFVTASGVRVGQVPGASTQLTGVTWHRDGFVVFGTAEGELVAARPDGTLVFRTALDASIDGEPDVLDDGRILVGDDLGHLHAVSPTGQPAGRYDARLDFRGGPVHASAFVVAASLDGTVHLLGPDLTPRATAPVPGRILARPLLDANQHLVIATTAGIVALLDPRGSELGRVRVGADVLLSPLPFPDGTLLVISDDGVARGFRH